MTGASLIVIAKAPEPGRSKTRLSPPLSPAWAAELAEAALLDTLEAVAAVKAKRRLIALEGPPGSWLPEGFDVVPQRGQGLAARLAQAFEDAGGPAFLVAMDTPQLDAPLLTEALDRLERGADAVLGPALDGGYWGIGLRRPDRAVFAGVPMSTSATCALQLARLRELGLATATLPLLRDVDAIADARAIAAAAPCTRFAAALVRSGHAADDREPVAVAAA